MIDINKKYRTRDGREVRIYATDGQEAWPTHGAVLTEYGWSSECWNKNGSCLTDKPHGKDLIEVRPRQKWAVWMNIYDRTSFTSHFSREQAEVEHDTDRIACIKVELDFEEGEGL